jgi:hypothetical protein
MLRRCGERPDSGVPRTGCRTLPLAIGVPGCGSPTPVVVTVSGIAANRSCSLSVGRWPTCRALGKSQSDRTGGGGDEHTPVSTRAAAALLQSTNRRGITTTARLDVADIDMAVFDPASPPIAVDRGLFQDQRPRMRSVRWAMYLDACRLIAAWWPPVIASRRSHSNPPLSPSLRSRVRSSHVVCLLYVKVHPGGLFHNSKQSSLCLYPADSTSPPCRQSLRRSIPALGSSKPHEKPYLPCPHPKAGNPSHISQHRRISGIPRHPPCHAP